jgi:tetratricopeptide (TPR) repeat protein
MARLHLERAIKLAPDKPGPRFGLGSACAALGEHRAAIAAFSELHRINRSIASVALRIADSHMALKEPEQALRVLHQAVRRSRNAAVIHKRIGDIYVSLGRYAPAVEEYRAAVLNRPETIENDPELKSLLESGGDPELLAKKIQQKLASAEEEWEAGGAETGLHRPHRFRWLWEGLGQAS